MIRSGRQRFFEGTEKKVEVRVSRGGGSLRKLGVERWSSVTRAARAKILSKISSGCCDAYLLSESSLFVYDDKMMMRTCGRTTLAEAVVKLLEFVPAPRIRSLIYARKNENFPRRQPSRFQVDAALLGRNMSGRTVRLGSRDGQHLRLFHFGRPSAASAADETVELIMHDIGPGARAVFRSSGCGGTGLIRERTGIHELRPGFQVDDHVFRPRGYSLNAVRGRSYYTVHVTPEVRGSYASFETNMRLSARSFARTLAKVLGIFEPRAFELVLFQPPDRACPFDPCGPEKRSGPASVPTGYRLKGESRRKLSRGCEVRFLCFTEARMNNGDIG
ncbi:MAG: adenosylmethionine decarboxylase [Elusimicrobiota bacterium]